MYHEHIHPHCNVNAHILNICVYITGGDIVASRSFIRRSLEVTGKQNHIKYAGDETWATYATQVLKGHSRDLALYFHNIGDHVREKKIQRFLILVPRVHLQKIRQLP